MKNMILWISITSVFLALPGTSFAAEPDSNSKTVFVCGKHQIEVSGIQEDEDYVSHVRILDLKGQAVFPIMTESGIVVSLCKQSVFLLLDTSAHYAPGPSYLLSENGRVVMRMEFGEVDSYGKSDDDKIFWIQSRDVSNNKTPIVKVKVYSFEGKEIASKSFEAAATFSLKFQNQSYTIKVEQPEFPG